MSTIYIGADNGISGSWSIFLDSGDSVFFKTPVIKCLSYTKEPQHIHRIDWQVLQDKLANITNWDEAIALIERPLVNPRMFKATQSALRSLEATIIVFELLGIDYSYTDSKCWQREFLSSAVLGHDEMKKASKEVGLQMFPEHKEMILKHGDADGLFIGRFCQMKYGK